jgi:ribosomal protein S18 acetylase RimI-like enzyme
VVERGTVNALVAGSNPVPGARLVKYHFLWYFIFMPSPSIEVLDFASPDVHASAAARLLRYECDGDIGTGSADAGETEEQAQQSYLSYFEGFTIYGITGKNKGVFAAGLVLHGYYDGPHKDDMSPNTDICALAVHSEMRGHGYGNMLVRHIAEQALAHGDPYLLNSSGAELDHPDEFGILCGSRWREIYHAAWQIEPAQLVA